MDLSDNVRLPQIIQSRYPLRSHVVDMLIDGRGALGAKGTPSAGQGGREARRGARERFIAWEGSTSVPSSARGQTGREWSQHGDWGWEGEEREADEVRMGERAGDGDKIADKITTARLHP